MNPSTLYQAVILEHNRKPRHYGRLSDASHQAEGVNPLCGDHIRLDLKLEGGRIAELAFEGESCALCKASASMMTVAVRNKTPDDATALARAFRALATGEPEAAPTAPLGHLSVFSGVHQLPGRVKCAVLPWHTLTTALQSEAPKAPDTPQTGDSHAPHRRDRADAQPARQAFHPA